MDGSLPYQLLLIAWPDRFHGHEVQPRESAKRTRASVDHIIGVCVGSLLGPGSSHNKIQPGGSHD